MSEYDDMLKRLDADKKQSQNEIDKKLEAIEKERLKQKEIMTKRELDVDIIHKRYEQNPELDKKILDKVYNRTNGQKRRFKIKRRTREERMIDGKEHEGTKSRANLIVMLAIIGMLFMVSLQYTVHEEWVVVLIILLGSFLFLPFGMIIGWSLLDPYMRCKILRKTTRKNYGIINFVGKGQKIASKIKNFDTALIWKQNETWVITKEHVYQLTKDGDKIVEKAKIDPESIVTLIDTVPVLFVDIDSMQPLSLARDRREGINPLELGSTLKAWVDNQMGKAMFLRKTLDIYLIIVIICSVMAIGITFITMNKIDELSKQVSILKAEFDQIMTSLTPPT
jgi:hypothetical protein